MGLILAVVVEAFDDAFYGDIVGGFGDGAIQFLQKTLAPLPYSALFGAGVTIQRFDPLADAVPRGQLAR